MTPSSNKKNNIIIVALCAFILLMSVAYAIFHAMLGINATTNISGSWNVYISNVTAPTSTIVGNASNRSITFTNLQTTFIANLSDPGDSITYNIEVTNNGSLNSKLSKINKMIINENDFITITTSGLNEGDTLNAGETKTLYVTANFNNNISGNYTTETTSTIKISLDFIQA